MMGLMQIKWPHRFVKEGQAVGRILTGYSDLEVGLMHCVQMGLGGDFDTVLKAMFKKRGETLRINEAERLGSPAYDARGLGAEFRKALTALRYCLKIRNQYAHWVWWDDNTGKLAFANLEDLSKRKRKVPNLDKLKAYHMDIALLTKQEAYFVYVDHLLGWVNYEGRLIAEQLNINPLGKKPSPPRRPPMRLP
jgi:hypothetical protein